jgi:hypothetical protein
VFEDSFAKDASMLKVEIWGAVKVDHKIYRDNEILRLVGKPIAHWEFASDLPDDKCDICVGFGGEKRDFPGSDRYALHNALDYAKQCLGVVI